MSCAYHCANTAQTRVRTMTVLKLSMHYGVNGVPTLQAEGYALNLPCVQNDKHTSKEVFLVWQAKGDNIMKHNIFMVKI